MDPMGKNYFSSVANIVRIVREKVPKYLVAQSEFFFPVGDGEPYVRMLLENFLNIARKGHNTPDHQEFRKKFLSFSRWKEGWIRVD